MSQSDPRFDYDAESAKFKIFDDSKSVSEKKSLSEKKRKSFFKSIFSSRPSQH